MTKLLKDKRTVLGLIIVILGVLFLLRNLDIIDFRFSIFSISWKFIILGLGILMLFTKSNKTPGIVLTLLGVYFLLPEMLGVPFYEIKKYWPVLLVLIGIAIIYQAFRYKQNISANELSMDFIDMMNVFGGGEKTIVSDNFRGGKITNVFGGSEVSLVKSNLSPDKNILDVFCLFGGAEIVIPADWNVKVDVVALFGGFSDKKQPFETKINMEKELFVRGFVIFGGGEIKRV